MKAALAFGLCISAGHAIAAPPPPGQLFNLSTFDLQLPVSDGNGGVVTVSAAALKTYTSAYFYTNATTNGMTFFCPINGAHTSGSDYPRSELRERPDFTFEGTHVMNVTMRVNQVSAKKKITIGQVHKHNYYVSFTVI